MRDIYLIDFENVASEGLSGITYLSEDDQVIIFYSNNSNRISMKMHILIGKSVCKLDYFEVLVGGKNALDHQLSTWLGYLIGTGAAERNYYIVSRDMGYKHVANFWSGSALSANIRCIDAIKVAGKLERQKLQKEAAEQPEEPELAVEATEAVSQPEAPAVVTLAVAEVPAAETPIMEEAVPAEAPPTEEPAAPAEAPEEAASEGNAEAEAVEKQEERIRSFHNRNRTRRNTRTRQKTADTAKPAEKAAKPAEKAEKKVEKKPEQKNGNLEQLSALLLPYPALQENHLRQLITDNKRQVLCNTLRKQLGQEKGLALYNDIKKIAWR